MMRWVGAVIAVLLTVVVAGCSGKHGSSAPPQTQAPTPELIRSIAKSAYTYGFPMVDNYRVMHSYFVDKSSPEYKGPWNQVHNSARVYTPQDTAIQTPNSDTPYSVVGADLRTEPLVFTLPPIEPGRYYSAQFVDLYTYNIAYAGSRTTGNGGGKFLLAGPSWRGETPLGIDQVIHSDTDLNMVLFRTQLFGPSDLENVKKIQAGYQVTPLSAFLNQPPPPPAPPIDFIAPLSVQDQRTSPKFFEILNFALKFAPVQPAEEVMRQRFAILGIGPDGNFDAAKLTPEAHKAVEAGMADAWTAFETFKKEKFDTGEVTSAQLFGTASDLRGNYLYRMAGAVLGIYGNTAAEAIYPSAANDSTGAPLNGANNYTLRFAPGQLPPVNAFWSVTMYEMPQSLLVANPINRYLINSAMLPTLVKDPDGGITLNLQNKSPGPAREPNWLPTPAGPFAIAIRLYWPKPEALDGTWKAPKPVKVP
ncbi:DUF1254 domain-containing protein [Mycobacterium sp. OTB74]|uniref:DUF1254 domain-containing protein n=1 Tax=Mycobacterium sp. OTB74 TaxID=1853452 RepID=UPI0024756304|nr:DUF1254 domain-containing protein [Mycobacterium sp. OTB74]MDH6246117.1 hypothetical protein [Mycobacterium sp. OTB74]